MMYVWDINSISNLTWHFSIQIIEEKTVTARSFDQWSGPGITFDQCGRGITCTCSISSLMHFRFLSLGIQIL